MTERQKIILIGGAAVALLILKSKKASASTAGAKKHGLLSSLKSTLLPSLGPNTTALRTTNMATRGGTATQPRIPSSGLGTTRQAGIVTAAPSTVAQRAITAAPSILGQLLSYFGNKGPAQSSTGSQSRGAAPASGQNPGGGSGSTARPGASNDGGSGGQPAGSTPVQQGYWDENGNWVPMGDTAITAGYFDQDGNWVSGEALSYDPITGDYGSNPVDSTYYDDATGQVITWQPLPSGAVDENGDYDPSASPAAQVDFWEQGNTGPLPPDYGPDYGPNLDPSGMPVDVSTDPFIADGVGGMDGAGDTSYVDQSAGADNYVDASDFG